MQSLQTLIQQKGSAPSELLIEEAVEISGGTLVTVPKNLAVRIAPAGKMVFQNAAQRPQLEIEGSFEAGLYPVFQFDGTSKDTYPVLFRRGSVKEVLTCWFGALPDRKDMADSQLAIQRAVYAAADVGRIYMPAGDYWIDDTIHLDHPDGPFISYTLEGGRPGMATGADPGVDARGVSYKGGLNRPTQINARFKDRPAIDISLARDTQIKNLSIKGLNQKAAEMYLPVGEVFHADEERCREPNISPANWTSDGCTRGRHNPYCAIATDGYGREPGVIKTYYGDRDRYVPREYSTSGSSQILIEGVEIQQFVVGIAISPAGAPQNDMIRIQQSSIKQCAYGVAVGTTQARGLHVKDNWITECYAAIDNVSFGEEIRAGSKLNCTSNVYSKCRNVYRVSSRANGSAHFSGEYAENIIQLGHLGLGGNVGSGGSSTVFTGCDYAFGTRVGTMRLLASYGTTTFFGCDFRVTGDEERSKDFYFMLDSASSNLVFQSCSFQVNCNDGFPRFFTSQYADWHRIHFRDCTLKRIKGINAKGCGKRKLTDAVFTDPTVVESGDLAEAQLSLSDDQVVNLADRAGAYRCPLHLNSQTLRVRDNTKPYRFFHLKYTAAVHPFIRTGGAIRVNDEYSVSFEQADVGSFWEGDRIYCQFYLKEYPHLDALLVPTGSEHAFPALMLPLLEVQTVMGKTVTAHIPLKLRTEIKLPTDFKQDQLYVQVLPRLKNAPYVMINDGCRGQFTQWNPMVTDVTNIDQLEEGDLVNGDYTNSGTRIIDKDETAGMLLLSRTAIKSSNNELVDVPAVITREV